MSYTLATPGSTLKKGVYEFSNLGSLYCLVAQKLANRDEWQVKVSKTASGRFNLILGEAQAGNIPYKMLAGYDSLYPGLVPLCNFYRGFNVLCRKTMMVKTLRSYITSLPQSDTGPLLQFEDICPVSFMFFPAKPIDSEREQFIEAALRLDLEAQEQRIQRVVWIVKPSDGCKGHSITLFSNHSEVLQFIDSQTEGSISWVVQRYIDNPILIPRGQRKFDIRVWVLLDSDYNIHVYRRGALRVAAQSYMNGEQGGGLMDLSDIHAHLSNHCIAETHPDYGKYEPTNELWYDQFEDILLEMTGGEVSFARDIIPRIHDIIRHSMLAVKDRLKSSDSSGGYKAFNVFGYDFMLSKDHDVSVNKESIKVWLIEVNSSPAVAEDLLNDFVDDLLEIVIDPAFPPDVDEAPDKNDNCKGCSIIEKNDLFPRGFDLIYRNSDDEL